jgi:hypothetical protein
MWLGQKGTETMKPVTDWLTEPAHTQEDATAKFKWWATNHGVIRAYANVSIRERKLIPQATRVAIIQQCKLVAPEPQRADDLRTQVIKWAERNVFAEITTRKLAEEMQCTQHVARRLIKELPNYFKQLNQYTYEVRDYNMDREADRRRG